MTFISDLYLLHTLSKGRLRMRLDQVTATSKSPQTEFWKHTCGCRLSIRNKSDPGDALMGGGGLQLARWRIITSEGCRVGGSRTCCVLGDPAWGGQSSVKLLRNQDGAWGWTDGPEGWGQQTPHRSNVTSYFPSCCRVRKIARV